MDEPWACALCTYINESGGSNCEMCTSARPAAPPTPAPMQVDPPKQTVVVEAPKKEPAPTPMQVDPKKR